MIYALIGFLVLFGILAGIGITRPRGTSIKVWCYLYLVISLVFDLLVVIALIYQNPELTQLLLGVSAGSATGLAIHLLHHISEENESQQNN